MAQRSGGPARRPAHIKPNMQKKMQTVPRQDVLQSVKRLKKSDQSQPKR
jgi:hypothetical protein